jgi:flagellar basal-body rod protein FlgG
VIATSPLRGDAPSLSLASNSQRSLDMFRSLNIAATGMAAQETQLNTIANNLANANTVGYKRQNAEFEDLLYQTVRSPGLTEGGNVVPTSTQVGTGSRIVATSRSFAQGGIQQTGNPLDVAIQGSGFLMVMRQDGTPAYTRAGTLKLDAQGRMTTTDGLPLDPPITIPSTATNVTIGADGTVTATQQGQTNQTTLGQLQVTTFPNAEGLNALGQNLYQATDSSGHPQTGVPGLDGRGSLLQGAVESSNVDVVTEMVQLIGAQNAYEMNSKVVSAADQMLQNATQMR